MIQPTASMLFNFIHKLFSLYRIKQELATIVNGYIENIIPVYVYNIYISIIWLSRCRCLPRGTRTDRHSVCIHINTYNLRPASIEYLHIDIYICIPLLATILQTDQYVYTKHASQCSISSSNNKTKFI